MLKNLAIFTTVVTGLGSIPATAGPGVALVLGAKAAVGPAGRKCLLHATFNNPYVAMLHFEGSLHEADGKTYSETYHEVNRFLQDVKPHLPALIQEALAYASLHKKELAFVNGTYDPDLFKEGAKNAVPAYTPGPVSTQAFIALNKLLVGFLEGTYQVHGRMLRDSKGYEPYRLKLSASAVPGAYAPHLAVTGPATYPEAGAAAGAADVAAGLGPAPPGGPAAGAAAAAAAGAAPAAAAGGAGPVGAVTVTLFQDLKPVWQGP